jgi:Uri superfamily endonuclease
VHWHIDYPRAVLEVTGAWVGPGGTRVEHAWAAALGRGSTLDVDSAIGASDCDCVSRLFRARHRPRLAACAAALAGAGTMVPRHELRV